MWGLAQLALARALTGIVVTAWLVAGCGGSLDVAGAGSGTSTANSSTGSSSTTGSTSTSGTSTTATSTTGSTSPTGTTSTTGTTTTSSGTTSTSTTTGTQTATPLSLQGSPSATVMAGAAYGFQPTPSTSSTPVSYSIGNQPSWASFNASTGELTGTPTVANVGTTNNITITASNGTSSASIGPFSITVTAGSASLSWVAPVANTDGSILNDLAGYHIYYGTSATSLTNQISVIGSNSTTYVVSGLATGTYYFAVSAYSSAGTESAKSNVGSKTI